MRAGEQLWAVGDITGKGAFTHVSMYQAAVAVRDILGEDGPWADYRAVTRVTFTDPEVASVGLTEEQARERASRSGHGLRRPRRARLAGQGRRASSSSWPTATAACWSGPRSSGPPAARSCRMLVTAVHAEVPIATLRTMHFAYPTFHRAIETVLDELV